MLSLVQQGAGWTVTREGRPVDDQGGFGITRLCNAVRAGMTALKDLIILPFTNPSLGVNHKSRLAAQPIRA